MRGEPIAREQKLQHVAAVLRLDTAFGQHRRGLIYLEPRVLRMADV